MGSGKRKEDPRPNGIDVPEWRCSVTTRRTGVIRVKLNDHVRHGSVIGLLGYTDESTGPHLHLHISDNNSPLNAEGRPYQLGQFIILGSYPSIETFGNPQLW
jgi:murein DD-endopeptidase